MQSHSKNNRISPAIRHGCRIVRFVLLCGPVLLACGCHEENTVKQIPDDVNRIVGRWRSPPQGWRNGEWGPTQIVMELKPSGDIKQTVTISDESPGGGGVLSDEGTYQITNNILTTDLIARGEPVKFEFNRDNLIMTLPQESDEPIEVYEFVRE